MGAKKHPSVVAKLASACSLPTLCERPAATSALMPCVCCACLPALRTVPHTRSMCTVPSSPSRWSSLLTWSSAGRSRCGGSSTNSSSSKRLLPTGYSQPNSPVWMAVACRWHPLHTLHCTRQPQACSACRRARLSSTQQRCAVLCVLCAMLLQDLLQRMLCKDLAGRPRLPGIMTDPWVSVDGLLPLTSIRAMANAPQVRPLRSHAGAGCLRAACMAWGWRLCVSGTQDCQARPPRCSRPCVCTRASLVRGHAAAKVRRARSR